MRVDGIDELPSLRVGGMTDTADHERTLHYLVDAVSDYAIYMLDVNGCVASWNTGAYRLKGYSEAEIRGQHFSRFFLPEDRAARVPEGILAKAEAEGRVAVEGWRIRKDGERFWTLGAVHAVRNEAGVLIGYAKVTRDMTLYRQNQEELFESERRFRLLVEGVVDYAIYMLDPNGVVTNWNRGAERIKGWRAGEIVGKHFSVFYTPEDQQDGLPARALDQALRDGRFEAEGYRVRKDGTPFWASVIIDVIRDEDGALTGFAKITRDITEKRQAQLDLQRAHERLAQSQKLEALGKLTGGVAHDFNNLLMVVSGQAQLLRRKIADDPRALRALDAIEVAARRGEDLTRHLLSFSRRQRLTPEPISLADRASGLRELLSASLPSHIAMDMIVPADLWPMAVDAGEFELALLNLTVNARDAMPAGGTLKLSAANVSLNGSAEPDLTGEFVALTLADTGSGIAPDILPKIFDPFFTTKDVDKGTGLGLSQVFGFAQQSGGQVVVASELGVGTQFTLYLPRADRAPVQAGFEVAAPVARSARILLVEDNPEVAEVAARMLEELGHQVRVANSGAAALALLETGEQPDLLFSDIVMAGVPDGLGMARHVRAAFPGLPIVLATGYSEAAARIGDEFPILRKPYKLADLGLALARGLADADNLVDLEAVRRARAES